MNMPEMDGLELIKKLRQGGSDVPIIILTGNNEISVAIDAINSGANDYLLKDENIQDTSYPVRKKGSGEGSAKKTKPSIDGRPCN